MANSYRIQKGELVVLKKKAVWKYRWRIQIRFLIKLGWALFALFGSWLATYAVYSRCVSPVDTLDGSVIIPLLNRISIGALFATFASAVIGVFTLFATQHLELFYENMTVLWQDLASEELSNIGWKRWSFLPRMGKLPLPGNKRFSGVKNASIRFTTARSEEVFLLPTTLADFQELPILRSFLRIKLHRKSYFNYLSMTGLIAEYPAWDCLCAIYKSILLYRFCYFCIWVATCFILQSIVFSFFYESAFAFIPV